MAPRIERREAAMAEYLSEIANTGGPVDAKEELLDECEDIWKQMEECQSKLMLLGTETLLPSDAKLYLLMLQWKALTVDFHQWQARNPELISTNPDVLLELGKEELQKVKNDLEMVLSTVQSKNKQLEEDLKREQQWYEEQKQMLETLNKIEEEENTQVEHPSTKSLKIRELNELKNKVLKLKTYKEELLSALGGFLDEHFPLPEIGENIKKKPNIKIKADRCYWVIAPGFAEFPWSRLSVETETSDSLQNSSAEPVVELKTLQEILEMLINTLIATPHEPYITINESFWPPYIELLLRHGMALRHPEDPNRMRLQAFHK
ncbi:centromere protein K isoform X2 [Vidua macroura]|uniref:centromere protein K isoform X2 n=1 Tax=Vidua macroura TaxID=187451 RepID=UPI0023A7EE58|nr:centromere protein K isoform X2 [Vidua macroura]